MNRKPTVPFIGVRLHENRTPTGRRTSTPAKRAALYAAYGSGRTPEGKEARLTGSQRGEWLSPDGREQTHDEVMAWLREESLRNRYTFEALLSVRDGDLTSEAFCKAMGQGEAIPDWRLMMHNDTNNRHAHVLFFGAKRMEKKAFLAWQGEVRAELVAQEKLYPDVVRLPASNPFARGSIGSFDKMKSGLAKRLESSAADTLTADTAIDAEQMAAVSSKVSAQAEPAQAASDQATGWGMGI